jgi:hypothetical protein
MRYLNVEGRSLLDLFQGIGKRYRFGKYPQSLTDYNSENALEFNSGTFLKGASADLRVGLTIYNNGLVADSLSSTENSEAFLQDIAQWSAKKHNFHFDPALITRKAHVSQIEIQFEKELPLVNPKLRFLPAKLYSQVVPFDGAPAEYRFGGISSWPANLDKDRTLNLFRLERKWNTPFEENIYFSAAPLTTHEHVAILNEIETALE